MKPLHYAFNWLCRHKATIAKALHAVQDKYLSLPKEKQAKFRKATATALALLTLATLAYLLTACNVTRTVTTTSSTIQRGDTTVIIQSKTIESYDATKRM